MKITKEQAQRIELAVARALKHEDIGCSAAAMVENILETIGIKYTWYCYSNENIEGISVEAEKKTEIEFTDGELGCIADLIENELHPVYGHANGDAAYYLSNAYDKINIHFEQNA